MLVPVAGAAAAARPPAPSAPPATSEAAAQRHACPCVAVAVRPAPRPRLLWQAAAPCGLGGVPPLQPRRRRSVHAAATTSARQQPSAGSSGRAPELPTVVELPHSTVFTVQQVIISSHGLRSLVLEEGPLSPLQSRQVHSGTNPLAGQQQQPVAGVEAEADDRLRQRKQPASEDGVCGQRPQREPIAGLAGRVDWLASLSLPPAKPGASPSPGGWPNGMLLAGDDWESQARAWRRELELVAGDAGDGGDGAAGQLAYPSIVLPQVPGFRPSVLISRAGITTISMPVLAPPTQEADEQQQQQQRGRPEPARPQQLPDHRPAVDEPAAGTGVEALLLQGQPGVERRLGRRPELRLVLTEQAQAPVQELSAAEAAAAQRQQQQAQQEEEAEAAHQQQEQEEELQRQQQQAQGEESLRAAARPAYRQSERQRELMRQLQAVQDLEGLQQLLQGAVQDMGSRVLLHACGALASQVWPLGEAAGPGGQQQQQLLLPWQVAHVHHQPTLLQRIERRACVAVAGRLRHQAGSAAPAGPRSSGAGGLADLAPCMTLDGVLDELADSGSSDPGDSRWATRVRERLAVGRTCLARIARQAELLTRCEGAVPGGGGGAAAAAGCVAAGPHGAKQHMQANDAELLLAIGWACAHLFPPATAAATTLPEGARPQDLRASGRSAVSHPHQQHQHHQQQFGPPQQQEPQRVPLSRGLDVLHGRLVSALHLLGTQKRLWALWACTQGRRAWLPRALCSAAAAAAARPAGGQASGGSGAGAGGSQYPFLEALEARQLVAVMWSCSSGRCVRHASTCHMPSMHARPCLLVASSAQWPCRPRTTHERVPVLFPCQLISPLRACWGALAPSPL